MTRKRRDGTKYIRYKAVLSLGVGPDGKRQRLNGPLRATRPEAVADLSSMRRDTEHGVAPDRQRLDAYLLDRVDGINVKDRTRETYKADNRPASPRARR